MAVQAPAYMAPGGELQVAQLDAQRKMKLADMLRQQSAAPMQGQMAGRVYVGPSWTQGLSKMLQGYVSGDMEDKAYEGLKTAQGSFDTKNKELMTRLVAADGPAARVAIAAEDSSNQMSNTILQKAFTADPSKTHGTVDLKTPTGVIKMGLREDGTQYPIGIPAEKLHFGDTGDRTGVGMDQYTGAKVTEGFTKSETPGEKNTRKHWKEVDDRFWDGQQKPFAAVNDKGENVFVQWDRDGNLQTIPDYKPPTVKDAGQSGRAAVFTNRILSSANQATKDLANVVKLPLTVSTGILGGRKQGPSLFEAGKEVMANKMTGQEAQAYNAMATGFQRSLAAIEAAGLMPTGNLTHQMDAVMFKEGDTNITKLHKLAQTRQIIESGLEILNADPKVPKELKDKLGNMNAELQAAVPFSHQDVLALQEHHTGGKNASIMDMVALREAGADATSQKEAQQPTTPKPTTRPVGAVSGGVNPATGQMEYFDVQGRKL